MSERFHLLSALSFSHAQVTRIFNNAEKHIDNPGEHRHLLQGRCLLSIFREGSDTTRINCHRAMLGLGGWVISHDSIKSKSFIDLIEHVQGACDLLLIRSDKADDLSAAGLVSKKTVINAGDGANEHPIQAYANLFTIRRAVREGRLPNRPLHVYFHGDVVMSRTIHSQVLLFTHGYGDVTIGRISANALPAEGVLDRLYTPGISIGYVSEVPRDADIVYIARVQKERYLEGKAPVVQPFTLLDAKRVPQHALIMHSFPRGLELPAEVDLDDRAIYLKEQARFKLPVTKAIFEQISYLNQW